MISLSFQIDNAARAMDDLARTFYPTVEDAVGTALAGVISHLIPVTPVRTGAMQRDYGVLMAGPAEWQLVDTAASPAGYPYPARVVDEAGFSRAYPAIQVVLDQAEDDLTTDLRVVIDRVVQAI